MNKSSKIRACMLTDAWLPWWGGGQTHIWEVSKILVSKYDYDVDIIVPNLTNSSGKNFPQEEKYFDGKLRVIRLGSPFVFPNFFGRLRYLISNLKFQISNSYDLYHSHSYSTSIFLPLLKLLRKGKIIFTLHGAGTVALGVGIMNDLGLPKIIGDTITYKYKYDALITVAKKSLTQKTNTHLVSVIGNGVNLEGFEKIKSKKSKTNLVFLWVGRFVNVKGLPILIKAVQDLIAKHPNVLFKLIGDGPEKEAVKKLIESRGLEKNVAIEDSKFGDSLIKEYKSANAFILPSISGEGFPITIIEAMAAGLPVIASDIGDTDKLVRNGETGYLVKPGSADDLKQKLSKLIKSPNLDEMGKKGNALVKQKYTWDNITKQIYSLYQEVLKS